MANVLSLPDAKTHLNITDADSDGELQSMIASAEALLTERVGALQPTSRTDRVAGGYVTLTLPVVPVISLTSVTSAGGSTVTVSDLFVDAGAGLVTYNSSACFVDRYYTVVYSAGRATCPDDLTQAIKEMVRHLWKSQQGSGSRPGTAADATAPSFLLPYKVQELIAPHVQPGFA